MLSVLILLQPLSRMLLVMEYQVNKNYIATVLCVNKAKPLLKCEGKCQLIKGIKASENQENNLPVSLKGATELIYFCQEIPPVIFNLNGPETDSGHTLYKPLLFRSPVFAIFHPPQVLV